ncbi:MAG TPA: fasciclin domain-containing protein [Paludibacter sp.]
MDNKLIKCILRTKILFLSIVLFVSCTDEIWNQHYNPQANIVANDNLWTTIENTPELSRFAKVLKSHGYDKTLSQTQAYTIFAPDNNAMEAIDTSKMDVKKELIENHISRYFLPATGYQNVAIATLNGKRNSLYYADGRYHYGDAQFANPAKDIVASNGIVHVLNGVAKFSPNIWEYLSKRSDMDSLRNYLYSFNDLLFVPELSVPGGTENGQQTYLDSVFVNYNKKLSSLRGYIDAEDSSYIMLAPNNAAWQNAYNNIKSYYKYSGSKNYADSMQRVNTKAAMVKDLFFNSHAQKSPVDSMVSTVRSTFYNPQYLFDGADMVKTSNGLVYITNDLKIDALSSWFKPITVEAEQVVGREALSSTAYSERVNIVNAGVSGNKYLRLTPSSSTANPSVTFDIPGTLSSTYDISCVFVSPYVYNPNALGVKKCKVYFNLTYTNAAGMKADPVRYPATGTIEVNPNKNDSILAFPNITFPVANAGEKVTTVKVQIISFVLRSETSNYSRELLIDCILLKPKKQQ